MGGLLGHARIQSVVEEHGSGKQLVRLRSQPRSTPVALSLILLFALLSVLALIDNSSLVAAILGIVSLALALRCWSECSRALETVRFAALLMGFVESDLSLKPEYQPVPDPATTNDLIHAIGMKLAKGTKSKDRKEQTKSA